MKKDPRKLSDSPDIVLILFHAEQFVSQSGALPVAECSRGAGAVPIQQRDRCPAGMLKCSDGSTIAVVQHSVQTESWKKNINKSNTTKLDPKTKLQEYSLKKNKILPIYRLINSSGPKHNPTYKISVLIRGSNEFVGQGSSKQEAEQNAASKLLKDKNID